MTGRPSASPSLASVMSVLAGVVVVGVLAGVLQAWLDIRAERYLEFGLTRLAWQAAPAAANAQALRVSFAIVLSAAGFAALRALLLVLGV